MDNLSEFVLLLLILACGFFFAGYFLGLGFWMAR